MSHYPISGCGLPSKPRAAQPSMFQILSWNGDNQLSQSKFQQPLPNANTNQCYKFNQLNCSQASYEKNIRQGTDHNLSQTINNKPKNNYVQQVYKQHESPQKIKQQVKKTTNCQNEEKKFKKSHLFNKQIKPELYSYQPVNLKASRSKSALPASKPEKQQNQKKKQQIKLDQKTIKQRKQKLKDFQVFTRILPNSAFTTYYGKPAFQNYGRGTSYQNLKSFNVMPHKGDNHPKNVQSHYTALIKARNTKSKSYVPRKPIEDNIQPSSQQQNQQLKNIQLPLQKPDLIKSYRFATIAPQTSKKAGPPKVSKRNIQSAKKTVDNVKRQVKSKSFRQVANDGLKYINKRQNLIDLLQEKKLKASQLAYKVTQCYPGNLQDLQHLQEAEGSKQNWRELKPAGKASNKGDPVRDLIQSRFVLQQTYNKAH